MKKDRTRLRQTLLAVLALAALYTVMFAVGWTCPIKEIAGISCPGCGMTRACISALRFDFKAAFSYHPLWICLVPFALLLLFFSWKKKRILFRISVWIGVAALVVVYAVRMTRAAGDVVVFAPQNGLIGRAVRDILVKP